MSKPNFKPLPGYVFLKVTGETKTKSGILTSGEFDPKRKTADTRYLEIKKVEVIAVGEDTDEIKIKMKVGDKVFPQGFVFNQVVPPNYLEVEQAENIKYLWAKADSIIGIVGKPK